MDNLFLKLAKKINISNLAILLLCANCTQPGAEESNIPTIDITGNISKAQKVNLSTIASSIEYCMLETDEKCLVASKNIYSSGDCFVSMGGIRCYVFERNTGNFVRQISQVGQGPNDYQRTVRVLDGDNGQICLEGNHQYLFFNLDGTLSHKTKYFAINFMAYGDLYVRYVQNSRGNSTVRIAFYDSKTGEVIDSIPNYRHYVMTTNQLQTSNDFSFHTFNNSLYYMDIYCDTLYQIKDFTLQPRYIFNTGGRTVPYELQDEGRIDVRAAMMGGDYDRWGRYIVINRIHESTNYLYFTFDYRAMLYPTIYHKAEGKIQLMPPVSIPPPGGDWLMPLPHGFENDLDGGLPFWPQQMISDQEMMCVYTVTELLALDASKITDPKLKFVLNSLEEDSNPVVAIVTLKD